MAWFIHDCSFVLYFTHDCSLVLYFKKAMKTIGIFGMLMFTKNPQVLLEFNQLFTQWARRVVWVKGFSPDIFLLHSNLSHLSNVLSSALHIFSNLANSMKTTSVTILMTLAPKIQQWTSLEVPIQIGLGHPLRFSVVQNLNMMVWDTGTWVQLRKKWKSSSFFDMITNLSSLLSLLFSANEVLWRTG